MAGKSDVRTPPRKAFADVCIYVGVLCSVQVVLNAFIWLPLCYATIG